MKYDPIKILKSAYRNAEAAYRSLADTLKLILSSSQLEFKVTEPTPTSEGAQDLRTMVETLRLNQIIRQATKCGVNYRRPYLRHVKHFDYGASK